MIYLCRLLNSFSYRFCITERTGMKFEYLTGLCTRRVTFQQSNGSLLHHSDLIIVFYFFILCDKSFEFFRHNRNRFHITITTPTNKHMPIHKKFLNENGSTHNLLITINDKKATRDIHATVYMTDMKATEKFDTARRG